jgi:hypothetical protein
MTVVTIVEIGNSLSFLVSTELRAAMKQIGVLFLEILAFVMVPAVAEACSCGQTTFVTKQFGPDHTVLIGKVASVVEEGSIEGKKFGSRATATIIQFFWGPRERVEFSNNTVRLRGSSPCDPFQFIEGATYFLSGFVEKDGTLVIASCGFSGLLEWDRTQLNLKAIALGPLSQSGAVLGKVQKMNSSEPAAYVDLVISGDKGEFHTISDNEGTYLVMGVPEGDYHLKVDLPGWTPRYRSYGIRVKVGEYSNGSIDLQKVAVLNSEHK